MDAFMEGFDITTIISKICDIFENEEERLIFGS